MAVDEQVRVRRFLWFRVFWKLVKMIPVSGGKPVRSGIFRGTRLGGRRLPLAGGLRRRETIRRGALTRSRELMTGLDSAGRALAIRHFALAAFAFTDVLKSLPFLWKEGAVDDKMWSSRRRGSRCSSCLRRLRCSCTTARPQVTPVPCCNWTARRKCEPPREHSPSVRSYG